MKQDTPWTYTRRLLIVSVAWIVGMPALYCGGFWLFYGHLPPWN